MGLKIVGKPVLHGIFYNNGITKRDHIVAYLCDVKGDSEATPKSMEIAKQDILTQKLTFRHRSWNSAPNKRGGLG